MKSLINSIEQAMSLSREKRIGSSLNQFGWIVFTIAQIYLYVFFFLAAITVIMYIVKIILRESSKMTY